MLWWRPLIVAILSFVVLGVAPAHAGPCSSDIARIEAALRRPGSDVGRR